MRESEDMYTYKHIMYTSAYVLYYVCVCVFECEMKQNQKKVHIHYSSMHMEECLLYLVAFGASYRRD